LEKQKIIICQLVKFHLEFFLARCPQLPFHEGHKDRILSLEALIGMMIEKNCSYIDDSFYEYFLLKNALAHKKSAKS
jgi:hypothetical protein